MRVLRVLLAASVLYGGAIGAQGQDVGSEPHPVAQAAADAIRDLAGTDGALVAAGLLKEGTLKGDLASIFQFPTDRIVVVELTGKEILEALERSVSSYPSSSKSFLQLSGFVVTFSGSAAPESRILDVQADGRRLDPGATYSIAMPESLARGALGYFRIWNASKIKRTLGTTVEQALSGKTGEVRESRYIVK